ncbi:class I adenylate-forming enzyme family protein [Pseudomonas sp. 148P]|uniref:Class I adenylate-forming enzyme family protein n=1 Tax=Pseudomonas ulcerans TaxID=3115852 RepID=A0ABU7HNU8_9PSED|nr:MULTISPECIES: class I adenylate-forming enzyme family protein [unclassified Pseudomonas]MEE1926185.1 class I adenylate-forming enzyme family protein [Pseudomonas sp. 147P]MEE1933203.1 class I adenylate-forming enzyme family protein [Pseudomonas sp. 148P]
MNIEHWRNAWQQLIAPGAPFEVMETGQGTRLFRHAPRTLQDVIESARVHGDREFLVWQDERLTFAAFFDQVERLAGQLLARFGLQPGERVAIALRNQPAWLVAFAAVQRCGGVCVPLNSWGLRDELLHGLEDSGAGLLLCDEARLNLLQDDLTARQRTTVVVGLPATPTLADWCFRYEDLLAAEPLGAPQVSVEPDAPALILYTSGTTSRAKGALSSHRAVCQALTALEFQGMFCAMSSPERIARVIASGFAPTTLMAVPLFHVSGLHAQFLSALRAGRRLVLMYKWDVDKAIDLIRDERCTQFNGAPVMMQQLLASPRFGGEDTVSLFGLGLGGGASSAGLLAAMAERKPDVIGGSGYGLTESNGIGAAIGGEQFLHKPASAGWPLPIVDVRIGDSPGQPLPAGAEGVVWLRSPTLMEAYWNLPGASAETLREGWLDTGDIGYLDDDGFLHISGRIKELINRGGEKISAAEIETCVGDMPGVDEVAVFAVADAELGEAVALVIQGEAPPTAEEARAFVAARLAGYKVPAHVFRVSEALPRNASGKVLKGVLRQQLLG